MLLKLKHEKYYTHNIKTKSIFVLQNINNKQYKFYDALLEYNYLNLLLVSLGDDKIIITNLDYNQKNELIQNYFKKYYDNLGLTETELDLLIDSNINDIILDIENDKKKTFDDLLELLSNIIYYCNNDIVKYIHTIIPKVFNNKITYIYNFGYPPNYNYHKYNFIKASLDNLNYENIKYLIKEHGFNFWENITINDSIIYKKNKNHITNLLEILEIDNINKYLNNQLLNHYLSLIKRSEDDILIKIYSQLSESDNVKDIILNIIIDSVYNVKYKVIKYIFNSDFFNNNFIGFLTTNEWIAIINQIYRFEHEKSFNNETDDFYNKNNYIKNNINRSKITNIIFKKILLLDDIILNKIIHNITENSYDGITFGNIIRLPNITKSLKLIEHLYVMNTLYNIDDIVSGLVKYGYIDTIKYVFENFNTSKYLLSIRSYIKNTIIDNSLLNKNNKVCIYVIEQLNNSNIHHFDIVYEFLKTSIISSNNKIIKLKILNKNFDIEKDKYKILQCIFNKDSYKDETIDDKIVEWSIKKFLNNTIDDKYIFVLEEIVNSYNLDLLKKYLKIVNGDINIWKLIIKALDIGYYFYDYYVQYLLSIADPLKEQNNEIKKNFLKCVLSYNEKGVYELKKKFKYPVKDIDEYNDNTRQKKYNDILKYCKDNNVNLNQKLNYSYGPLLYISYYGNSKLFKAAIMNGISFRELINRHEKDRSSINYFTSLIINLRSWAKLYYLIKRLEFKIYYKNRKKHHNIFTSSVVEIDSKPPLYIENKPVLKKGGTLFYRDMDEFDILSDNYKTFVKPTHIEPYELYSLSKKEVYLAQKTDGILVKNIDKNEIYPPLDKHFNNIILDGEYIPELNLYLIFNQRSNYTENTDYLDDYYELYSQHNYCKNSINLYDNIFRSLDSKELINEKLKQELICILTFVNIYNDIGDKKLWFPKIFWKIEDIKRNLEIISIMEKYLQEYNLKNNLKNNRIIKNDGMIIMEANNKKKLYKYKPIEEMTADLAIDNKIWRCRWDDNKWNPYEIRDDKKYPNPQYVIDILENYHKNPWNITNILKYIKDYGNSLYYQKYNKQFIMNNKYYKEFFTNYKTDLNCIIKYIYYGIQNKKILDLGCGYLNNLLWREDNIIDGIDIDLGIIEKYECLKNNTNAVVKNNTNAVVKNNTNAVVKNSNKRLFLGDLSNINKTILDDNLGKYYNKYTDLNELRNDYNIIISNMSFHNVFKTYDGFDKLMSKINSNTVNNSQMLITFIDKNLLFQDTDMVDLLYGSYIKKMNDNKIKIYYSWTHNNPIIEDILYTEFLVNNMETKGWYVKEDLSGKIKSIKLEETNPWIKIRDSIKIINFIKK